MILQENYSGCCGESDQPLHVFNGVFANSGFTEYPNFSLNSTLVPVNKLPSLWTKQ